MYRQDNIKTVIKRITAYGRKPRTGKEALRQVRMMFEEEGRWVKSSLFEDGDPAEAYENASCGSWSACLVGGIGLVTGDMQISVVWETSENKNSKTSHYYFDDMIDTFFMENDAAVTREAMSILFLANYSSRMDILPEDVQYLDIDEISEYIFQWNDSDRTKRTDVLDMLDKAIKFHPTKVQRRWMEML